MTRSLAAIAVVLVLSTVVGCSSSTSPTSPSGGGTPLIAANRTSVFHIETTTTDANGNQIGSTTHVTDSIMETGVTYQGQTNCVHVWSYDDKGTTQDGYYSLTSGGDLKLYLGPLRSGIVAQWLTMPFGGGSPVTTRIEDTTIVAIDPGTGAVLETAHTTEDATYSHDASESLTVQGKALTLDNVRGDYLVTQTVTVSGHTNTSTSNLNPFHYYWSREVGFMAKSQYAGVDPATLQPTVVKSVLVSYTLR